MLRNRKYKCDFCNRSFYSKFVLRPYKCNQCGIGKIIEVKEG